MILASKRVTWMCQSLCTADTTFLDGGSSCSLLIPVCPGDIGLMLGILNLPFILYSTGPLIFWVYPFGKDFCALPLTCTLSSVCFLDDVDGGAYLPCALGPLEATLLSLLTVYLLLLHRPAHSISKLDGFWSGLCMPDTGSLLALLSLMPAHKVAFL